MNSIPDCLPDTDDMLSTDPRQLVDISDINIDITKDKEQRIEEFVTKIHNPYCFRCHNMVVRVSFTDDGMPFQELLQDYFNSLA